MKEKDGVSTGTLPNIQPWFNGVIVIVPFGMCVWSTGLAANPLLSSITELKKHDKTGSCVFAKSKSEVCYRR